MGVTKFLLLCLFAFSLGLPSVHAKASMNGYVAAGLEHDNNLAVDELDASSDQNDEAWVMDAGLEGAFNPAQSVNLILGYDFSGRRYHNLDQFDQDAHLLSADLSVDIDAISLGTSYHYSYITLDTDRFLDLHRASVYLGSLVGDSAYVLGSLHTTRKDFAVDNDRNSDTVGGSFDTFLFFNGSQRTVVLGVDIDNEDAKSDAFNNRLIRLRATYLHRFKLAGNASRFRLGVRYEDRQFDDIVVTEEERRPAPVFAPIITERTSERTDTAWIVDASWRLGLNDTLSLEPSISYGNYTSPVASADFDRLLVGLSIRADF